MSDSNKFKLNIRPEEQNEWFKVSVIDGSNKLIAQQTGSFEMELPKGLYTLKTESKGISTSQVILHDNDDTHYIKVPDVPKKEMVNFDEIAENESETVTTTLLEGDSKLFVFLSSTHDHSNQEFKQLTECIQLYDANNQRVSQMAYPEWRSNADQGWLAFSTELHPGVYYLSFKGLGRRSFIVEAFPDCQSQVFIQFEEELDLSTFTMQVSSRGEYEEEYSGLDSFNLALDALHKRKFDVSDKVLDDLAYGKWKRPMYGIVVAYLYLLGNNRKRNGLFEDVVNNLSNSILDSPYSSDLRMIQLLFEVEIKERPIEEVVYDQEPFDTPPMLQAGLRKLYEFSNINPDLIEENSITDLISDRLYKDSPWTSFKPYKSIHRFEVKRTHERGRLRKALVAFLTDRPEEADLSESNEWIEAFLPRLIEVLERQVSFSIKHGVSAGITVDDLALELNLPLVSVRRKVREVNRIVQNNPFLTDSILNLLNRWFDKDFNRNQLVELLNRIDTDEGMGQILFEEPALTQ